MTKPPTEPNSSSPTHVHTTVPEGYPKTPPNPTPRDWKPSTHPLPMTFSEEEMLEARQKVDEDEQRKFGLGPDGPMTLFLPNDLP